jgi:hypothetical protein
MTGKHSGAVDSDCMVLTARNLVLTVGSIDLFQFLLLLVSIGVTIYCIKFKKERSIVETIIMPLRLFLSIATLALIFAATGLIFSSNCVSSIK